jgi:RNA polymerase sigma-70 factor (ECF subfamily)
MNIAATCGFRSLAEAEDIVQEAFLRYHRAISGSGEPDSPKAYLSAVTTRLCIDYLRSARARREAYVGEWLPEPLVAVAGQPLGGHAAVADPADLVERADSLSMAFLLLLERLSPVERAVFLLHDVFGYGYGETASIVGKSREACRQLAHRARRHIDDHRPRFEPSAAEQAELAAKFLAAASDGDVDGLISLLAADVDVRGDSGGMRPSWPRPVTGREKVSRLIIGLVEVLREVDGQVTPAQVNGQPGALFLASDGTLVSVLALDISDGQVKTIRSVISRDKLRHLGPLADIEALYEQRRESRPSPSAGADSAGADSAGDGDPS